MDGITLLGLGPGNPDLLTRSAWQALSETDEIYLRTRHHPVIPGLPSGLKIHSFDRLYEQGEDFSAVYAEIVAQVLSLGRRSKGVIYAVPGHPFIAEATGPEIFRQARNQGLPVRVIDGLSFIEPLSAALGLDLFPQTALVDALELAAAHVPSFPISAPALIAQIHSRSVASDVKLTLMELYPDEHPVNLVHAAGTPDERVENVPLHAIDRSLHIGLLTALYVPALRPDASLEALHEVVAHLRAPEGCPWDREQTHQSLRSELLEEAYEVLEAIDSGSSKAMEEELGDLLMQVLMHAQIASEEGEFSLGDMISGIHKKLVRRHPHVFGEVEVAGTQEVLQNWERLKAAERAAEGKESASLLDGIMTALPALVQAQQIGKRAARVGFDWPTIEGVRAKVDEELDELKAASPEDQASEIGDLLFAVVNLARWYHIDAESALRETNARFRRRFAYIEQVARRQGRTLGQLTVDEMEALWQAAKKEA